MAGKPEPGPRRWEVYIPGFRPTSLNVLLRMHWARRAEEALKHEVVVGHHLRMAGVPPAAGRRRIGMRITLAGKDKAMDDDNVWKLILDACVARRYLLDDGAAGVERAPVEFERGFRRATTLILEDIACEPS